MVRKYFLALVLALSIVLICPAQVSAHDIIRQDILEYVKNNPNITPQELDDYINQQSTPSASQNTAGAILQIKEGGQSFWDLVVTFVKLGIEHILSGPDHILFVLSLLLVFRNVIEVLKLFTAFTVAHSTTLILSGTGLLTLSSHIVEPIIALSIAYVAITSVFLKNNHMAASEWSKIVSVFFFGLFHGLGFAGVLTDFSIPSDRFISSLLFFNVGIEFGQIVILAVVLPGIYLFWKKSWYPRAIRCFSLVISMVALIWVVERVFQISLIS